VLSNGQPAKYYDQVISILESNKGKTITATVLRDEKEEQTQVRSTVTEN
jgi:regulator of sigma E protease